jgi:hypothetical protein
MRSTWIGPTCIALAALATCWCSGSVTRWLQRLEVGDPAALPPGERDFPCLVGPARMIRMQRWLPAPSISPHASALAAPARKFPHWRVERK